MRAPVWMADLLEGSRTSSVQAPVDGIGSLPFAPEASPFSLPHGARVRGSHGRADAIELCTILSNAASRLSHSPPDVLKGA